MTRIAYVSENTVLPHIATSTQA